MPFSKLVHDPDQARILNAALHEICLAAGIRPASPDVQFAIAFLMGLYWRGHRTAAELRAAVDKAISREA